MDYQKIPGTTVMQKNRMPENSEVRVQKLGIKDFVGAATDGKYAAVAFDFQSPHDPLIARKSWFFFDNEYVCLGAGISCKESEFPVFTTLNQCVLQTEVSVSSNGNVSQLPKGEKVYNNLDWIYQGNVGYIFPNPTAVTMRNKEATGSWWRVNRQTDSPKNEIKLDVFTAWLNHGVRPSEETYQYIVVPATSVDDLKQSDIVEKLDILVNTPEIQAVAHSEEQIFQGVFYKAGEVQILENLKVKTETPGIVMMQVFGQESVKITVSDPNRELGKMVLAISAKIAGNGKNFKTFWNNEEGMTYIVIDLPQGHYAGSSVTIEI
jgi:chondroitin AC lyase